VGFFITTQASTEKEIHMEFQEVKNYLKENADKDEVKVYLAELSKVSSDKKTEIIEEFKKSQEFLSEIDRAVTKGVNTFKDKTVPGLIEIAVTEKEKELEDKYNPPKNPAEENLRKKVEELETKYRESESKIIRESIKTMKQHLLAEKGLSVDIADWLHVPINELTVKDIEDKEKLLSLISPAIEPLVKLVEDAKIAKATEIQTRGAGKPQDSDSNTQAGQLTREQYNALPREERVKAIEEGKCQQILGQ
jgi:hypothetical protein